MLLNWLLVLMEDINTRYRTGAVASSSQEQAETFTHSDEGHGQCE